MKIKSFKFTKKGKPKKITVEMSLDEAAFITKTVGRMNSLEAVEVMEGADLFHSEIYYCFVGELFNKFYYNGVDGYINGAEPHEEKM